MNKAQFIQAIATKTNLSKKEAAKILETITSTIIEGVKRDKRVTITGFGSFYLTERKARDGRNPQTGAFIRIPEKIVLKFKPRFFDIG